MTLEQKRQPRAEPGRLPHLTLAARSTVQFLRLLFSGHTHLRSSRIGNLYSADRSGRSYQVFRETVSHDGETGQNDVLIVGFRLRLIRSNRLLHWIFRRICIVSTPIWSGFPGFRVKLWLIDPKTKNYLGIYEWTGAENARVYAEWLIRLLRPLSTPGSVWYELRPNEDLPSYLDTRY
jgi:hypothetical protein